MAVQTGLWHLRQKHLLSRYLREEITRDEAAVSGNKVIADGDSTNNRTASAATLGS